MVMQSDQILRTPTIVPVAKGIFRNRCVTKSTVCSTFTRGCSGRPPVSRIPISSFKFERFTIAIEQDAKRHQTMHTTPPGQVPPTRRRFLTLATAALGTACVATPRLMSADTAGRRLNVLLITADDLDGSAMGWMGCPLPTTTNLDALAAGAICFARMHDAAPICQPSRSAMMTGRVPHRNGALGFDPIKPGVPTLPGVLAAAGWFTAGFNKLGHMAPVAQFAWELKFTHTAEDGKSAGAARMDGLSPRDPAFYGAAVRKAVTQARESNRPFFINLNIIDPHRPFYGTDQDRARGGVKIEGEFSAGEVPVPGFLEDLPDVRTELAQYYTSARRTDLGVGEALRALRETGAIDDTIIVFVADHGMPFPWSKTTLYQHGTHTPCLIRLPASQARDAAPRVDREHFASNVDLMPTLLELLGVAVPTGMDGRSLTAIMRGAREPARDHVFTQVTSTSAPKFFPSRCVRDEQHSYIWNHWPEPKEDFRHDGMNGLTWAALVKAAEKDSRLQTRLDSYLRRPSEEFYDLTVDPSERTNALTIAAHGQALARARSRLLGEMERSDDPLLGDYRKFLVAV